MRQTEVMLVKDLFEILSRMDGDLPVHIAYNYGDHSRTTVCPKVTGVCVRSLAHSQYFNRPVLDPEGEPAVVIACFDSNITED